MVYSKSRKARRQKSGGEALFLPIGSVNDPDLKTSYGFQKKVSEISVKYNL